MTATEIYRVEGFEWRNTRLGRFIERYGYGCVDSLLREAAENPEPFWEAVVADIGVTWLSPYRSVLATQPHAPARGWFHGGKLNVAVDAVDKWAKSDPDRIAIAWEGGDGTSRILTTQQLMSEVSRVARGLADLGIGKGDRVAVSLPILPEAAVVMLAIARIGAVVVPLAWAAEPKLTTARLRHSGARVVFCADGFLKEGREFSTIGEWREILPGSPSVETIIVIPRLAREGDGTSRSSGIVGDVIRELDYDSFGTLAPHGSEAIGVSPSDPFILSYASSSSGARESLIHTHLGFVIKTCQDMAMSFDVQARDCVMWLAEFDWTSGSWLVFGALALGASLVLIEDPAGRTGHRSNLCRRRTIRGDAPCLVGECRTTPDERRHRDDRRSRPVASENPRNNRRKLGRCRLALAIFGSRQRQTPGRPTLGRWRYERRDIGLVRRPADEGRRFFGAAPRGVRRGLGQ